MKMDKNINAIEKIIAELAMKDFCAMNPINKDGRRRYTHHRPYSLSAETNEAREIKRQYLADEISEAEYKTYCLHYNLRTV